MSKQIKKHEPNMATLKALDLFSSGQVDNLTVMLREGNRTDKKFLFIKKTQIEQVNVPEFVSMALESFYTRIPKENKELATAKMKVIMSSVNLMHLDGEDRNDIKERIYSRLIQENDHSNFELFSREYLSTENARKFSFQNLFQLCQMAKDLHTGKIAPWIAELKSKCPDEYLKDVVNNIFFSPLSYDGAKLEIIRSKHLASLIDDKKSPKALFSFLIKKEALIEFIQNRGSSISMDNLDNIYIPVPKSQKNGPDIDETLSIKDVIDSIKKADPENRVIIAQKLYAFIQAREAQTIQSHPYKR